MKVECNNFFFFEESADTSLDSQQNTFIHCLPPTLLSNLQMQIQVVRSYAATEGT